MTSTESPTKMAFVSILGAPNAGKSTLVNALVGANISIVTPKVQTTRTQLRGIAMVGQAQLILIDTPGVFAAKKTFEKTMVGAAWQGMMDADQHLLLIDAKRGICANTEIIFERLTHIAKDRTPVILVLNKVDLVVRHHLLALVETCNARYPFLHSFMISARTHDGMSDLTQCLVEMAPPSPWMYDPETLTTAPIRFLAAEITREQLFMGLRHELPYQLAVATESWEEKENGSIVVHQVIYVEKAGQKEIVIGKAGQQLKQIGMRARYKIGQLAGVPIHLFLHVKVRENWSSDPENYSYMK
jgi:GTP-binding protein Era